MIVNVTNEGANSKAKSFRIQLGMLSGPTAFDVWSKDKDLYVSYSEINNSSGTYSGGTPWHGGEIKTLEFNF